MTGSEHRLGDGYLEDFQVGQQFGSGTYAVTAEAIMTFARMFDPQPFHLNAETAKTTVFRGLAASGWHTAAMTMRLIVDSEFKPAGGILGVGVDELRWLKPVRPDDLLRVESEVLETRPSTSRPDRGVLKTRHTTYNQKGEAVQVMVSVLLVPRRPVGPA
ncbi:MAG TPA: MaoC family dehydratase [bacterium]|nr:MaoC family dehydratase [bacterium]